MQTLTNWLGWIDLGYGDAALLLFFAVFVGLTIEVFRGEPKVFTRREQFVPVPVRKTLLDRRMREERW